MSGAAPLPPPYNQPPGPVIDAQTIANAIAQAIANLPAAAAPPPVNTQVIADAIAAAFQNLPMAAAAVVPVPGPVPFACTPAGACAALLDYEKVSGDAKIFFRATQALPTSFSLAAPNVTVKRHRVDVHTVDPYL
jgi:hypothetical protein